MSLRADGIVFSYREGVRVLDRVNASVDGGMVTFVLGANGSGKTTLLACLAGILHPESGEVTIDGLPLATLPPRARARSIGYVPQIHTPVFAYTVWEVVLMGRAPHLSLLSRPGRRDRELAAQAIRAVGLWRLRDRPYTEISGGEQRLCLVARGLVQGVRYLLLDEPDAHLDPAFQHLTMGVLQRLAHGDGLGIMTSTHAPNNALSYADRVVILGSGRLLSAGRPEETIVPPVLAEAYGTEFELIESDGRCAVLPVIETPRRSRTG